MCAIFVSGDRVVDVDCCIWDTAKQDFVEHKGLFGYDTIFFEEVAMILPRDEKAVLREIKRGGKFMMAWHVDDLDARLNRLKIWAKAHEDDTHTVHITVTDIPSVPGDENFNTRFIYRAPARDVMRDGKYYVEVLGGNESVERIPDTTKYGGGIGVYLKYMMEYDDMIVDLERERVLMGDLQDVDAYAVHTDKNSKVLGFYFLSTARDKEVTVQAD